MLVEINNIKQNEGEPYRRIFNGEEFYLIVWFAESEPVSYQLFYNFKSERYCILWDKEHGLSFRQVDSGEDRPARHKMAAVFIEESSPAVKGVYKKFKSESSGLENELAEVILNTLKDL
jgi:hypothetical protein